jgi:3-hydroxyisobutyrate dehydrogenase
MRIGIAGLGRMGTAIAERLKEMGHDVVVWNRSAEKTRLLADAGAEVASTPADLAGRAEVILTILTDADAIDTVYRGPSGVLSADLAGKLVVEMSTVQPETEVKLAAEVRAEGAAFVECPVGGTVGPARTGKLIGLAGASEADFVRAKPILHQLCRRLEHVGEVGAGASMKLAINLPLMVFYQALGEAYALTKHLGKDTGWMIDLFADSSGGPNVLKNRGPTIAKALSGEDIGAPAFDVDSIRKDLRTMLAEGQAKGFDLPLVARTLAVFDEAAQSGWGSRDGSALPGHWTQRKA